MVTSKNKTGFYNSFLTFPGQLFEEYLSIFKSFFKQKGIKEINILGSSSSGIFIYSVISRLDIKIRNIYDSSNHGKKVLCKEIKDSTILFDYEKNLDIIIASSRDNNSLKSLINKLQDNGHRVYTLHDITSSSYTGLWYFFYKNLPPDMRKIYYENNIAEFWDIFGKYWYDSLRFKRNDEKSFREYLIKFRKFINNNILNLNPDNFLELGAGNGDNFHAFDKCLQKKYFGIDISSELISDIKGKICVADLRSNYFPFRNKSFDVTFTVSVLQHIPSRYIKTILKEMIRVSRKHIFHWEGLHEESNNVFRNNLEDIYAGLGYQVKRIDIPLEIREMNKECEIQCISIKIK